MNRQGFDLKNGSIERIDSKTRGVQGRSAVFPTLGLGIQWNRHFLVLNDRYGEYRLFKGFCIQSISYEKMEGLDDDIIEENEVEEHMMENISRKSQWILLAVASGACAAFNGVFAKLTTTQLTTSFAEHVAGFFGLGDGEKVVEYGVRGIFFLLNLVFNGIMWTLFTKALARGTSTVQVSIINTSSNFMITAVLGFIIFSESLPPLWFLGAALLVAGNVIIGRREEEEKGDGNGHDVENGEGRARSGSEGEEREGLLGEELELSGGIVEDEDVLDLGLDDEGKSDEEEDLLTH